MADVTFAAAPPSSPASTPPTIRPVAGRDDRIMLGFVAMIWLYLILSLAVPLSMMLWKSTEVRSFALARVEISVDTGSGCRDLCTLAAAAAKLNLSDDALQARRSPSLTLAQLFTKGKFQCEDMVRACIRTTGPIHGGVLEAAGQPVAVDTWAETDANGLRRVVLRAGTTRSLANFAEYFGSPSLSRSITNSFTVSLITTLITVGLAFDLAYSLHRTRMRFKSAFQTIAVIPILVPSLLAGLSLLYLFGNQGIAKGMMFGGSTTASGGSCWAACSSPCRTGC